MLTWFENMEVTRFLELRNPPGLDAESAYVDGNEASARAQAAERPDMRISAGIRRRDPRDMHITA